MKEMKTTINHCNGTAINNNNNQSARNNKHENNKSNNQPMQKEQCKHASRVNASGVNAVPFAVPKKQSTCVKDKKEK